MSDPRAPLRNFINDHCIVRSPPGYYTKGLNGIKIEWQFYLRRAIFDQNALFEISKWLYQSHDDSYQYAAMESAGPPLLASLKLLGHYHQRPIDGFAIRKEQKKYGLMNWVEGTVNTNKPVVILDDLANSKSTIIRAADVCQNLGFGVIGARTIVNKKETDNVDGIPVDSLFKISDFDLNWYEYYATREEPDISEYLKSYGSAFIKR